MSFAIKRKDTDLFIRSEIDSGGMSVGLMHKDYADFFLSKDEAESFLSRIKERYPDENLEIVPV